MNVPTERMVIDADAHVVEADHTWDFLEPAEAKYRPVLAPSAIEPGRQAWLVDGKPAIGFVPDFPDDDQIEELSVIAGRNMGTPQPSRYMKDVDQRLRHMDELGIDVQVGRRYLRRCRAPPEPERISRFMAIRADEPIAPSGFLQIYGASRVDREKPL